MFVLKLFGGAFIEGPNGVVTGIAARRHPLALVALLALSHPRRLGRDKLIALLWPESDSANGRNLLNQAVHALRRALVREAIQSEGNELKLNPDVVTCDVWSFEEALTAGDAERATGLYAGPFLDGLFLRASVEFDRWADGERERLRRDYLKALEELAEGAETRGDGDRAVRCWRELALEEPYNSSVMLRLMRALERVGDRVGAIRAAEAHAERLREELDAAPSPAVLALAERMRTQPVVPAAAAGPGKGSSEPGTAAAPASKSAPAPSPRVRPAVFPRSWVRAGITGAVLALLAVAGWTTVKVLKPNAHGIRRLAVLPLANLTGDPEQEYFVAGMHDALLTELGRIGDLTVISRQSTLRYQGSDEPVPTIARALGVEALVEGSVFQAGDSVRITVQLVRAEPEEHLWAGTYHGELRRALALQGEVARAIARAINARVAPAVHKRMTSGRAVDADAQDAYLRGVYNIERLANTAALSDSEWLETKRTAVAHLEEAVARAPEWAAAHAALARAYHQLVSGPVLGDESETEFNAKARESARRALELDETVAQAHAALGAVLLYYDWDWVGAEQSFRRALELEPNANNLWAYALYLRAVGRYEEAFAFYRRAEELNPLSEPLKLQLARTYSCVGRHREAIAKLEQLQALAGDDSAWLLRLYLGWEYLAESRPDEAFAELEAAVAQSNGDLTAVEGLAYGYVRAGRLEEARELAAWLEGQQHPESGAWTLLLAALGETDRAVARLQATVKGRRSGVPHLRCTYTYRELRDDPRIQELVAGIGFPKG